MLCTPSSRYPFFVTTRGNTVKIISVVTAMRDLRPHATCDECDRRSQLFKKNKNKILILVLLLDYSLVLLKNAKQYCDQLFGERCIRCGDFVLPMCTQEDLDEFEIEESTTLVRMVEFPVNNYYRGRIRFSVSKRFAETFDAKVFISKSYFQEK